MFQPHLPGVAMWLNSGRWHVSRSDLCNFQKVSLKSHDESIVATPSSDNRTPVFFWGITLSLTFHPWALVHPQLHGGTRGLDQSQPWIPGDLWMAPRWVGDPNTAKYRTRWKTGRVSGTKVGLLSCQPWTWESQRLALVAHLATTQTESFWEWNPRLKKSCPQLQRQTKFWCPSSDSKDKPHLSPTRALDFSVQVANKSLMGLSQVKLLLWHLQLKGFWPFLS